MGQRVREETTRASRAPAAAVGYLRRSTDRQEQSIPDQRRAIERFAEERGLAVERWYTDDAISGTSVAGRKAFQEMIADAQKPPGSRPWRTVIVYDVKRFGRVDNDEAGYYRHLLKTAPGGGVEVLYATEGFSGGETDDLLRPVKQWQARQESKDLSKVTIRGLLSRFSTSGGGGWWMGGVPPLGYDLAYENERGEFLHILRFMPDGTKEVRDERRGLVRTLARGETLSISKRDRARLILGEPSRVETVRRIFRMYAEEGKGLTAIADALNRAGTPTPRGPAWASCYADRPRRWCDGTVRSILVNPLYTGDMVWNRRTDARFHMIAGGRAVERKAIHGARLEPNDEADWLVVRGTHPAIVPRGVFERAREIRTGRPSSALQSGVAKRASGGWNGARARFILSGLVACARCGSRYQGVRRTKGRPRKDGSAVYTYSYGCGGYIAKGTSVCRFNPVPQEAMERAVCDAVLIFYKRYAGEAGRARLTKAVLAHRGVKAKDLSEARRWVEAERARIESTMRALLDSISPATRDLVGERLAELRAERERLATRSEELDRMAGQQGEVRDTVHDLERFLAGLEWTLTHGVNEERLTALRKCVEGIRIDKSAGRATLMVRALPSPPLDGVPSIGIVIELPA